MELRRISDSDLAPAPRSTRTTPGLKIIKFALFASLFLGGAALHVRYGVDTVRYVLYQLYQPSVQIQ